MDDERTVRRLAARMLEAEGFATVEACDGAQAWEIIRHGTPAIELVLSDIVMPRVNGIELMERLSDAHPELPVILMSGYAAAELAARGIAAPCSLLAKPFTPERLLDEVRRCLTARR